MKTRQQEMAGAVYEKISAYQTLHKEDGSSNCIDLYGGMAMKLALLVQNAGLVQALAFVQAKASGEREEPYQTLLNDIAAVVLGEEEKQLLDLSMRAEISEYMFLTRQTMLALEWFKRFSQSILKLSPTDNTEG